VNTTVDRTVLKLAELV